MPVLAFQVSWNSGLFHFSIGLSSGTLSKRYSHSFLHYPLLTLKPDPALQAVTVQSREPGDSTVTTVLWNVLTVITCQTNPIVSGLGSARWVPHCTQYPHGCSPRLGAVRIFSFSYCPFVGSLSFSSLSFLHFALTILHFSFQLSSSSALIMCNDSFPSYLLTFSSLASLPSCPNLLYF